MLKPVEQVSSGRRRYLTAADAFLLTGAGGLVVLVLLGLLFVQPSVWSEVLSQFVLAASALGGAALAGRLHGRRLTPRIWLGVLVGTIAGGLVAVPVFLALVMLGRLVSLPASYQEGPWGAVATVSLAVVAFLAVPVVDGVRDLARGSGSRAVAAVRLGALVVIIAFVVGTVSFGGELAEAAMFMAPVAAASALATVGVELLGERKVRRSAAHPGEPRGGRAS